MSKQIDEMAEALLDAVNEKHGHISMRGLAKALYNAGIRKQNEWIPVTDSLPEKNRCSVLIALSWEQTDIGWYDKDDKCWQSEFVNSYEDGEVTHWMPLPEPPETEKGGE
jgi:hypothetical protein